jgi:hypothetical protein
LERLLEILNNLADRLGLRAHTLLSLEVTQSQNNDLGKMVCLYNLRPVFIT